MAAIRKNARPVRMTEIGEEIQCAKCLEFWPADGEFFYKEKGKWHRLCKDCYRNDPRIILKNARWVAKAKEQRRAAANG